MTPFAIEYHAIWRILSPPKSKKCSWRVNWTRARDDWCRQKQEVLCQQRHITTDICGVASIICQVKRHTLQGRKLVHVLEKWLFLPRVSSRAENAKRLTINLHSRRESHTCDTSLSRIAPFVGTRGGREGGSSSHWQVARRCQEELEKWPPYSGRESSWKVSPAKLGDYLYCAKWKWLLLSNGQMKEII